MLHGLAVFLTWFVIYPVQGMLLDGRFADELFAVPVLLFLPTVIKALAAWMYGWWAVLYILPTALLQHAILGQSLDFSAMLKLLIYLTVAPLVRTLVRLLRPRTLVSRELRTWRSLALIVLASSGLLAGSFLLLYGVPVSPGQAGLFVSLFVAGDVAGSAAVLIGMIIFFRLRERGRRRRAAPVRKEA